MSHSSSIDSNLAFAGLLAKARDIFPRAAWPAVWLVGGVVRDALTGTRAKDLDFVTTLPAASLEQLGFRLVVSKSTLPIYFKSLTNTETAEVVRVPDEGMLLADLQ